MKEGENLSAKIVDGKSFALKIRSDVKQKVSELKQLGVVPGLAVIIVGEDPASRVYVNSKKKACGEAGIYSEEYSLPENITQDEIISLIKTLNHKPEINGILVQLPLPGHLDEKAALDCIKPEKDVDGFHSVNVGNLVLGRECFIPCTPAGVMEILKEYEVSIQGKECVIVGRSNIVGKPQAHLLLNMNGTVTICHSKTCRLSDLCKRADILVAAVGKPNFITADMIKPGATVIDVGINRVEGSKKIVGDVDFESVKEVAGLITPVPGGVGPMTIAMLLNNTVIAASKQMRNK